MRRRRPVIGIISGLIFGIFLAADLVLFGIVPLDSVALTIALIVGIVLGIAIGFTAPLGRRRAAKADMVPPEAAAEAVAGPAPTAVTTPPAPAEPPPPSSPPEG